MVIGGISVGWMWNFRWQEVGLGFQVAGGGISGGWSKDYKWFEVGFQVDGGGISGGWRWNFCAILKAFFVRD